MGAKRGVNCEYTQALVTNIFAFMASLDAKAAFDVTNPSVVSKILTLTGVHGHLTAALLAEMQDVRGLREF